MESDLTLPAEILSIVVSFTLEPWPTHYGTQYQAAVTSRLKNPFLLVNRACRQFVLDDFAATLWLEMVWYGPILTSPVGRFCPVPNISPAALKLCLRDVPTVKLLWTGFTDQDTASDSCTESCIIPFNYQDFIYLVDQTLVTGHNLDLSVCHLTSRTAQYVDEVIKPLLSFLTYNPTRGSQSKITMLGEHIPPPDPTFNWVKYLENAILGYKEYRRLKSLSLDGEAQSFALYASSHLSYRSLYEGISSYAEQASAYSSIDKDTPPRIQCMKILLEFSILADLIVNDLLQTDQLWNLERSEKFGLSIGEWTPFPNMYFGFPNLDVARHCHGNGLLNYTYQAVGSNRDQVFGHKVFHNLLVLANAMCPENDTWRDDFDNYVQSFNDREYDWERLYTLERVEYFDLDGVPHEWIGLDEDNDPDRPTAEVLRNLPVIQRNYKQWIKELEKELGIENGDWKMG